MQKNVLKNTIKQNINPETWAKLKDLKNKCTNKYLENFSSTKSITINDKEITFNTRNSMELYRVNSYFSKEPETLKWIKDNLKDDSVFYDIGANVGVYSIYASTLNPKAQILSFEPESLNFSTLCQHVAINGLSNIRPYPISLSDQSSLSNFGVTSFDFGHAFHQVVDDTNNKNFVFFQGTPTYSFDDLIQIHKAPAPTMIKIDVDGLENNILKGMKQVLEQNKLKTLLIELSGTQEEIDEQIAFLKTYNFEISATGKKAINEKNELSQNIIFSR